MIVEVLPGKLRGVEKKSAFTKQTFYAFLGVPYAKPPIGDLRFKAPVPIEKWDSIYDASEEGGTCVRDNEDCLYLNVYVPEAPAKIKNKKAAMIYIHGGAFRTGSGSARMYGPDFLIGHDIIYVTLNYRLDIFGFLNAGTPNCPGNAGLKDQLLAIKWVKSNISRFGGDPENITIFGESAGATSVHILMLSPLSKGLFSKAIVQSGCALSPWAIEKDPESRARKIGQLAGCAGEDLEGLVEYLKTQSASVLRELANQCLHDAQRDAPGHCSRFVFIPSVEKIKDGALLPDFPKKLLQSAVPIPAIFGFCDQEGLIALLAQKVEGTGLVDDLSTVVRDNFHLNGSQQAELLARMKEYYFGNKSPSSECVAEFANIYTDLSFLKFYEAIDYLIQSDVPPYIYLFAHDGGLNSFKNMARECFVGSNVKGACHADDLAYLFGQNKEPHDIAAADRQVIDHICTLWTNFAKMGDPASTLERVHWKPHTAGQPCYIRIEENLEVVHEKLFEERFGFWSEWSTKFRK